MLNLNTILGFQWDKGNESKNIDKHNISHIEAEQVFINKPLLLLDDFMHSKTEPRWLALGKTSENKLLHVTFTVRGSFIRVISARAMGKKERDLYAKANSTL